MEGYLMFSIVVTMIVFVSVTTVKYLNEWRFLPSMPSTKVDFGTAQQPNLERIASQLGDTISEYNRWFIEDLELNLSLSYPTIINERFALTPEKPNTARMVLPVLQNHQKKVADLYVIIFAPGDGTGKVGDYQVGQLKTPRKYQHKMKPERVLPRNKKGEGVIMEAFLPFFSVEGKQVYPYAVSLEQITVDAVSDPTKLIKGLEMGIPSLYFHDVTPVTAYSSSRIKAIPRIQFTCGYYRNGERFGDPHATYFNPKLAQGRPNLMQVAGFLAVESVDNPLCKVLDKIAIAPESE